MNNTDSSYDIITQEMVKVGQPWLY